MKQGARHHPAWRRVAAFGVAAPIALALLAVGPHDAARADTLCASGTVRCPTIDAVAPNAIDTPPSGPVQLTVTGTSLAGVGAATLLPDGTPLEITLKFDTVLKVLAPMGALTKGHNYRIQVSVGPGPNDSAVTPVISVIDDAPAPYISLQPAPNVTAAAVVHAVAVAAPTIPATAPPPGSGGSLWLTAATVAAGLVVLCFGGGACYAVARRHEVVVRPAPRLPREQENPVELNPEESEAMWERLATTSGPPQ
jgi:hypothetical protein